MRIFISAGEPSGDHHGARLIKELRRQFPQAEFVGFGGEHMEAAGCRLLYPLCQLAVMWFARVLANIHVFLSLASLTDRYFKSHKPDAVILIDYPGFNGVVGRRAAFHGIPTFYFLPPQMWAWGGWRVKGLKKWVDHVLCALPFEQDWYEQRGVNSLLVGHPFFDDIQQQSLATDFVERHSHTKQPTIALLPGSRTQEVESNFTSMIRAAKIIHSQRPDTRFLVAAYKHNHMQMIQAKIAGSNLPIEVHVGKTPEIISLAHSCISVSGSVSLELLYREKPTVVLYKVSSLDLKVGNYFKTCDYITLVNLLANKPLFPEFLVDHCPAPQLAGQILDWLNQKNNYESTLEEIKDLKKKVAYPGACENAAKYIGRHLAQVNDKAVISKAA